MAMLMLATQRYANLTQCTGSARTDIHSQTLPTPGCETQENPPGSKKAVGRTLTWEAEAQE